MRFDQYPGHCIVSNFRLRRDSHLQILTATETPSAPTLARSNLIRLSSLDWPSWLVLPAASALCRVTSLRIIQFPCISWIGIGENYAFRSFTFGLHLLLTSESSKCLWHLLLWGNSARVTLLTLVTVLSGQRRISQTWFCWIKRQLLHVWKHTCTRNPVKRIPSALSLSRFTVCAVYTARQFLVCLDSLRSTELTREELVRHPHAGVWFGVILQELLL